MTPTRPDQPHDSGEALDAGRVQRAAEALDRLNAGTSGGESSTEWRAARALAAGPLADVPASLMRTLKAIPRDAALARWAEPVRVLVMGLIAGGERGLALPGLRSGSMGDPGHGIYAAGEFRVHVRVDTVTGEAGPGGAAGCAVLGAVDIDPGASGTVGGQPNLAGAMARLVGGGEVAGESTLDDVGQFALRVAPGVYDLAILVPTAQGERASLVVQGLRVPAQRAGS